MTPTLFSRLIDGSLAAIASLRSLEPAVARASRLMADALAAGGKILACGNGGSAAESGHLTTELLCRLVKDRRSLPAVNLSGDSGFLTATANDYSFNEVFARQVTGLGQPGDVLVAFTTSGNSPNVLRALEAAREKGLFSIALLGRDGGKAAALADLALTVPAAETMHIQEGHQVLLHILCAQVEDILFPGLGLG
ncbi:MAG: SIS domain-containing protein [Verrucomicrobiaceae bacterium]|nr:MAG: SIS domain-containing protein [Verrucomicrobiaceae bacterium]